METPKARQVAARQAEAITHPLVYRTRLWMHVHDPAALPKRYTIGTRTWGTLEADVANFVADYATALADGFPDGRLHSGAHAWATCARAIREDLQVEGRSAVLQAMSGQAQQSLSTVLHRRSAEDRDVRHFAAALGATLPRQDDGSASVLGRLRAVVGQVRPRQSRR